MGTADSLAGGRGVLGSEPVLAVVGHADRIRGAGAVSVGLFLGRGCAGTQGAAAKMAHVDRPADRVGCVGVRKGIRHQRISVVQSCPFSIRAALPDPNSRLDGAVWRVVLCRHGQRRRDRRASLPPHRLSKAPGDADHLCRHRKRAGGWGTDRLRRVPREAVGLYNAARADCRHRAAGVSDFIANAGRRPE